LLSIVGSDRSVAERVRLEHGEDAAGGGRPVVQQLTTVDAGGGFRLQLQPAPIRTVVIIDILLTTRAAMHTTIVLQQQLTGSLRSAFLKQTVSE